MSTPRVFISYSHDGPDHKQWVEELAIKLRKNGVDAILDQWDAAPGDDIALFMEEGVKASERVLVICTPNYVAKANAGIGGVGYERMIVTAELVRNIGTNKFIPVLRDPIPDSRTPNFLSTRVFVDFSDGQDPDVAFDTLVRELHKAPPKRKPALGKSPFALSPLGSEASAATERSPTETASGVPQDAKHAVPVVDPKLPASTTEAYELSRNLSLGGADLQWQRLSKRLLARSQTQLVSWRQQAEQTPISTAQDPGTILDAGIKLLGPLFAHSLAAVESGRQVFRDQSGLILELLASKDWPPAGRTWFVNLPTTFVYVFHHLHGALCTATGQLDVALNLVERKVQSPGVRDFRRVCSSHELLGWPEAFDTNSLKGWQYLYSAPSRWEWLQAIFQDSSTYEESLVAYRMLLNIHELVLLMASGQTLDLSDPHQVRLDVPLNHALEGRDVNRRAFQLLLQHPAHIRDVWESRKVPRAKVEAIWPQWMQVCQFWVSRSSRAMFSDGDLAHAQLFEAL